MTVGQWEGEEQCRDWKLNPGFNFCLCLFICFIQKFLCTEANGWCPLQYVTLQSCESSGYQSHIYSLVPRLPHSGMWTLKLCIHICIPGEPGNEAITRSTGLIPRTIPGIKLIHMHHSSNVSTYSICGIMVLTQPACTAIFLHTESDGIHDICTWISPIPNWDNATQ